MKTFLLAGHSGSANRGCEAIVRSTVAMLRKQFGEVRIILSSFRPKEDVLWLAGRRIEIVPAVYRRWSMPFLVRKFGEALGATWTWRFFAPLWRQMEAADVIFSIGGDNYTLDYGPPWYYLALNQMAAAVNRPLVVWGASVGPFPDPAIREVTMNSMRGASLITARESLTVAYLAEYGVTDNVRSVIDPAFLLEPEPVDLAPFWPEGDEVLGLNVSPLLSRYRQDNDQDFILDMAGETIRYVLAETNLGILLIPHVTLRPGNDDHVFMEALVERAENSRRVKLMPPRYDAAQIKYIISQCAMLVAGRTHATIAGFSTGVPTLSLTYSQKGLGLNRDIFGDERYVVDVRTVRDVREPSTVLRRLCEQREAVRLHLRRQHPILARRAEAGAEYVAQIIEEN